MKKQTASAKSQALESAQSHSSRDDESLLENPVWLVHHIASITWDLKALNTIAIDLRNRVSYTDFVVVCTGTSERQVQAIAKRVNTSLREMGKYPIGTEGLEFGRWALLDYGDVIVHVFLEGARLDYDLEKMWVDAPRLELPNKPQELYGHFELEQFSP